MKRKLFTLISALLVFSCTSQLNEESIIGTWEITDFKSNADLSPVLIASSKELAKTYVYQINKDYSFGEKDAYNRDGHFGQWELDLEQSQIKFISEGFDGKYELVYEISVFRENEMEWIEDMKELGQNTITLKRCNECDFENLYPKEKSKINIVELDELSRSSTNLTNLYCDCMTETKNRESCTEQYNDASFELKILSDAAKEKFDIENEHAPSDNKYTEQVRKLRERLVDCRNGRTDNK